MSDDFDIAIVGGGIAGAGLGWALKGRRSAIILEAEEQCGYHSTGRSAAFFLESYGGPDVARLNRASESLLADPPRDFAEGPFLRRRGAIHLGRDDWPVVPGARTKRIEPSRLAELIPGIRPAWTRALFEPGCSDIDVAALHAAYLRAFRAAGGQVRTRARLEQAERLDGGWRLHLAGGATMTCRAIVNAAGAWADPVAERCGVAPIGFLALRRTIVQLRVSQSGLRDLPLVIDSAGQFYFKGEADRSIWLSPNDESPIGPCDCAPEEIDVATAIDRFEQVVDWRVEAIERKWAGLRTFSPDRLPVYGFAPSADGFFWCAGQGGFGIQSSPAGSRLAAGQLLGGPSGEPVAGIDPAMFGPARFNRS